MPKYTYRCEPCDNYYEISHPMADNAEWQCTDCERTLDKVPSLPLSLKARKMDAKPGDVVKSSIEEFKKDLRRQQHDASKKEV